MDLSFIAPRSLAEQPVDELARWAVAAGFVLVDTEMDWTDERLGMQRTAGLGLGPMRIRASLADSDLATREAAITTACDALDRAAELGLKIVWTLPRNFRNDRSQAENFAAAVGSLPRVVERADHLGIRIGIENCPFNGQNPVCTPESWDALFRAIPSRTLGICLDPSHCTWQGIDVQRVVREYGDRIVHVHAKDAEIQADGVFRYGIEGPQLTGSTEADGASRHGWWRYRLPGLGGVDWNQLVTGLVDIGYDGPITVEHEDPVWSGSTERVYRGLERSRHYLAAMIP